jgi:hypothetical protein
MFGKGLLLVAALGAALSLSGCVEFDMDAEARHRSSSGDCYAEQNHRGQAAQCRFDDGECWASQGPGGQSGGCRWRS